MMGPDDSDEDVVGAAGIARLTVAACVGAPVATGGDRDGAVRLMSCTLEHAVSRAEAPIISSRHALRI
jgi:hypothetical protein